MTFHQGNMIKKASPTHCCTENWSPWNQSFLLKKKNEKRLIARSRELKGYLRVFRRIKNTDASSQNLLQWEGVENHTTENVEVQEKNKLQKVVWVFFSPGGDISLFSPILSKDLSGPFSTSSKKFVWIVSKNICLINVKIW